MITQITEKAEGGMKNIKVRFAGIDPKPYDGTFTIIYIPDQNQILKAGQRYSITIEGLSYKEIDTSKSHPKAEDLK